MRLSLIMPAAFLTACVSRTPPAPVSPREATPVQATMGRTWDAVIDIFASRNIPIRTIERVSGLIVTDPLSLASGDGRDWADCGQVNRFYLLPDNATYNVLVRGDSSHSTVKTTVRWTHWVEDDRTHAECSTTHVWEREFEVEIKQRAEAQPLARAPQAAPPPPAPNATSTNPAPPRRPSAHPSRTSSREAPRVRLPRGNAELLQQPDFSLAVGDCTRLGLIDAYGESARNTLVVDLTDAALSSSSTEYNLGRLFDGYQRTTGGHPASVLELRHGGAKVGQYTTTGLVRDETWSQVTAP